MKKKLTLIAATAVALGAVSTAPAVAKDTSWGCGGACRTLPTHIHAGR